MYEGFETIFPLGKYSMAPILKANNNINIPTEKRWATFEEIVDSRNQTERED